MSVDNLHQVPARADTNSPNLSLCQSTTTRPDPRFSNGRSGPAHRLLFSHQKTVGAGTERCRPGCAVCYQSPPGCRVHDQAFPLCGTPLRCRTQSIN
jgi:hypothetical protein